MTRVVIGLLLGLLSFSAYPWNAQGHRLVAQIAYDNLTPKAKKLVSKYVGCIKSKQNNFVRAATWMDFIRIKGNYWYDTMHYINIPFSNDQTPLPPIEKTNAIWAIHQAQKSLASNKTTEADKRFALRVLIHVIGDLHQPLHAAAQVSKQYPHGDRGGNLYRLGRNPIGADLHHYWDSGAGFFLGKSTNKILEKKARQLEQRWPCKLANGQKKPEIWAKESHQLALAHAYSIPQGAIPNKQYQAKAQFIAQKRVAFAGCRLARVLNQIAARV